MQDRYKNRSKIGGKIVKWIFFSCALVSILTTTGIIFSLLLQAWGFFSEVSVFEFLSGTRWTPMTRTVSDNALLLEVLAGMPTIVYGYFALTFITPTLQDWLFPDMLVFNAMSAGIVMGLMIVPMVSSLSEDAMISVPKSLREGAYALGATRVEVALKIVVPAALSGIVASFILGISRAIGETMLVTIAAGATPKMTFNPLESIQTMTAYIVQLSLGETPHGSLEYNTIFAVGLLLFAITLVMNILGQFVVTKWGVRY